MWEKDDISQIEWLVKMMSTDGYNLDFSISSLIEIDRFFQINYTNGKLLKNSKFHLFNTFIIIESLHLYIEKILMSIDGVEKIFDYDEKLDHTLHGLKIGDVEIYTGQLLLKRAKYGFSHSLYPYYYELTKQYFNEDFQESFYEIKKIKPTKSWWRIR